MPCYTITEVKLELKNANLALLTKAINNIMKNAYIQLRDRLASGAQRPVFFHIACLFYVVLNIAQNDKFVLRLRYKTIIINR